MTGSKLAAIIQKQHADQMPIAHDALSGDFDRFYRENCDRAHRLAWRLVGGNESAAADVVQEAFIKAHRGLENFRAEAKMTTWFHRIVVNEAASYWRSGWVRRWFANAEIPEVAASNAPSDSSTRKRIAEAIGNLSRSQREAFVLVHLEEYTSQEAAEIMGVQLGSVKQHLHRALVHLRNNLGDLRPELSDGT